MGAIFLLSLMVVAAMLFLLSLIRWLFTGRKPSILMAVTAYQQWKHSSRWSYRQRSSEDRDAVVLRHPRSFAVPPHTGAEFNEISACRNADYG